MRLGEEDLPLFLALFSSGSGRSAGQIDDKSEITCSGIRSSVSALQCPQQAMLRANYRAAIPRLVRLAICRLGVVTRLQGQIGRRS